MLISWKTTLMTWWATRSISSITSIMDLPSCVIWCHTWRPATMIPMDQSKALWFLAPRLFAHSESDCFDRISNGFWSVYRGVLIWDRAASGTFMPKWKGAHRVALRLATNIYINANNSSIFAIGTSSKNIVLWAVFWHVLFRHPQAWSTIPQDNEKQAPNQTVQHSSLLPHHLKRGTVLNSTHTIWNFMKTRTCLRKPAWNDLVEMALYLISRRSS